MKDRHKMKNVYEKNYENYMDNKRFEIYSPTYENILVIY